MKTLNPPKFFLLAAFASLVLGACSSVPSSQSALIPKAARPEDVALADEMLRKSSGMIPPAQEALVLTPQDSGFVVELDQQRAYLYKGEKLVAVSRIASGRSGHRTETGDFVISQKNADHRSNIYGDFVNAKTGAFLLRDVKRGFDPVPVGAKFQGSSMRWFQRLDKAGGGSTAMGFHTGKLPGYPASHGCIRMPDSMAQWFFHNVPVGTPVVIRGEKYGVPLGTPQATSKRSPKVHSSLKPKPAEPAPETPAGETPQPGTPEVKAAEPAPAPAVESTPPGNP
jgi:lipoprotein-anchoring transpeptidase ErfK/SrfK